MKTPRLSPQALPVLERFAERPTVWRYGYELSRETGLKAGTLYPILMRLAKYSLLEAKWITTEDGVPPPYVPAHSQRHGTSSGKANNVTFRPPCSPCRLQRRRSMTASTLPRRAAAFLLRSAISIVPRDAIDWGHAMLSELCYVEGDWSALLWSLGSIGVLAKCALVTALFGNANYSIVPSGGHSFSKEAPVRKVTLYTTTACIIASLLFFVAPVFRQAFRVSLAQWHHVFHVQAPFTELYDGAVLKDLGQSRTES